MDTRDITLPNGVRDGSGVVTSLTIRDLNGDDEDLLRDRDTAKKGNPFDRVMLSTISSFGGYTARQDIDRLFRDMPLADHNFLMLVQRMHSMGELYGFSVDCPHCGEVKRYTIDLSTLAVQKQPTEYQGQYELDIPVDGVGQVFFRQLLTKDQASLEMIATQYPKERGTRELLLQVKRINGETVDAKALRQYPMRKRNAIRAAIEATMGGVNTELEFTCANIRCERGFVARMPMDVRGFFYQMGGGSATTAAKPYLPSGTTLTSWVNDTGGAPTPSES